MPRISVNLADVEAYENLPVGDYLGDISKIELKPTEKVGKFDQLMVSYLVVDGDLLGRVSSEWLSMSPKAAFRLKKWFAKFGLGDVEDLDIDDETNLLTEPDLVGTRVIFKVYEDKPKPGETDPSIRTALVSVEDEEVPAAKPAIAKKAVTPEIVDPKIAARAALEAQLAALDAEPDEAEPEEEKPARKAAAAPKTVAPAAKRTLR